MTLKNFTSYREYLLTWLKFLPRKGHGEIRKMAHAIGIQSSMLSQILNGKKKLNSEHAAKLTEYLNFSQSDAEYFILLIQYDKAECEQLKRILKRQIKKAQQDTSERTTQNQDFYVVPEKDRDQFYSAWYYSGIRLLTSLPRIKTSKSIAEHFNLSQELVNEVLNFLVTTGLVVNDGNTLNVGPARTHIDIGQNLKIKHQTNWRLKGLEKLPFHAPPEIYYSFPLSISEEDSQLVRGWILELINEVDKLVVPSHPEKLYCLNIDWFRF